MQSYTESLKLKLVSLYKEGTKVTQICSDHSIPRSTIYYWLNQYRAIMAKRENVEYANAKDMYNLERRMKTIETEYAILKECGCAATAPQKEKLIAIAKLDGKYPIRTICRALDVRHSTYYHYKRRQPDQMIIHKQDLILKPIVKRIFEETKGRLEQRKFVF